jgi:hypothetical protein
MQLTLCHQIFPPSTKFRKRHQSLQYSLTSHSSTGRSVLLMLVFLLQQMQAAGVRIAPYINGRIFDMGTQSWYISESRFLN